MARQVVQYWITFTHPAHPDGLLVPASGDTPCNAKNQAFERLEALKAADAALPQDNEWKFAGQVPA